MDKKIILFCIILMITMAALLGCSQVKEPEPIEPDTSLQDVIDKGRIIVGIHENMPPLSYVDRSGELVGFDLDLISEIAARMNLELQVRSVSQKENVSDLESGNVDMINGYQMTADDQETVSLSIPYLESAYVIMVRKGFDVSAKEDLLDKRIGTKSTEIGVIESDEVLKEKTNDIVQYDKDQEAISELGIGNLDAVIVDEIMARYIVVSKPSEFQFLETTLGEKSYTMGLRIGDTTLKEEVDRTIQEMIKDGTMTSLSQKWFKSDLIPQ